MDHPSSLILDLTIWNNFGKYASVKGKIDTGSDHTVIPDYLVKILNLKETGETNVRTVTGMTSTHSKYFVSVQIDDVKFDSFEVVAMSKEYVILGRDLINLWKLEIDGKSETYSIEPWSTNPDDVKTRDN